MPRCAANNNLPVMSTSPKKSQLVLGWQVNSIQEPHYWPGANVKPGAPEQDRYLAKVPAETIANHTAIIAQSGSGKSFFLGRLVEEIVLRTKSRCLIFDPNADFKRIDQIETEALWKDAKYDSLKRRGKLPHEANRQEFEQEWSRITIRVRGNGRADGNYSPLKLWWPSLSVEFLGEDLDPMSRGELYHCHEFVRALFALWRAKRGVDKKGIDLFKEAGNLLWLVRNTPEDDLRKELEEKFVPPVIESSPPTASVLLKFRKSFAVLQRRRNQNHIDRILATPKYVSEPVERFYFGKIREYMATRILDTTIEGASESGLSKRIEVVDLPSIPDKATRLLAINALLTAEWAEARKTWNRALKQAPDKDDRTPVFIVVDEAHNLIPAEPSSKAEAALRDQFRTIMAEGRKYGLFLVIVSQRPDKLDPLILSECENKAVMKISSSSVLGFTRQMLGLEDLSHRMLDKCLEFGTGRVLLTGQWSTGVPTNHLWRLSADSGGWPKLTRSILGAALKRETPEPASHNFPPLEVPPFSKVASLNNRTRLRQKRFCCR